MSSWASSKYNWLAGLFLVSGLAGTVAMCFLFAGGAPLGWNKKFRVRFSLADGTSGLKPGSAVLLGGQQVGRVSKIAFEWGTAQGETQVPTGVLVDVEMRSDIDLFDNAGIALDKPLLGTISALNITGAGNPKTLAAKVGPTDRIDEGDIVLGSLAPPAILAQSGFGPEQIAKVNKIIADTEQVMADARHLVSDNSQRLQASIEKAADGVSHFAGKLPEWSKSLESILDTVAKGAERLDPILSKIDTGVDRVVHIVDTAQKALDDNRARFDSIFKNVDVLTSGLAGDTLGFILETAREAPEIARSVKKASQDAEKVLAQLSAELPGIKRTLASTRQAADSLKIGIDEIVAQPWRVLQRPSTKELREQLVYDSARAYAQAVGDVRALGESLEAATAAGPAADPQAVEQILAQLKTAIEDARTAQGTFERHLLDVLIQTRGGTPTPTPSPASPGK